MTGLEPRDGHACGSDGVVRHSLEINDQAQLDALEGCERVAGDLLLRVFPGIDEAPLLSLRDVDGVLDVSAEQPVEDPIAGLRSLEEAGELALVHLTLSSLEPLGRLRVVSAKSTAPDTSVYVNVGDAEHNALSIYQCSGLQSLAGLSGLEETPRIRLEGNPDLRSLEGLTGLPELGALDVRECPVSTLAGMPKVRFLYLTSLPLTNLEGLGTTTPAPSVLSIRSNPLLTSLEGAVLPAQMDQIELDENPRLASLRGLEQVRSVGTLSIHNELQPSALESLAGLDGVEELRYLELWGQSRLSHLDGLDAVARVEQLYFRDCDALSDLRGLQNATADVLVISGAAQLASLQGAPRLAAHALFGVQDAPLLVEIPPLVAGGSSRLSLVGTGLRDLDALSNIGTLASLELGDNPQLRSLPAFSASADADSFGISNNPALDLWAGLTPLEQAKTVTVVGTRLRDLSWLSGLRSVGKLEVRDNRDLARLDLPDLQHASELLIYGNQKLDDARLRPLQALGPVPPGGDDNVGPPAFQIRDNLSGVAPLADCPFEGDGICDEELGTCAAGTDTSDCAQ